MTLEILTSDNLGGVRHGFFTRRGGASSGIYSGLNCGVGSSDIREIVMLNRARVAAALDVETDLLLTPHQVHSPTVLVANGERWNERPKADAIVTKNKDIAISVLSADCTPVLFADAEAEVIGVAHAGWKGAIGGVLEATIEAMENLGANRANISAAAGPTISQRNYEVGQEFVETFLDEDPEYARFFTSTEDGHYRFDLPMMVLSRLRRAGVGDASWIGLCTYAEPDRFYSYRRSTHLGEPDYGRQISAITLR